MRCPGIEGAGILRVEASGLVDDSVLEVLRSCQIVGVPGQSDLYDLYAEEEASLVSPI